LQYWRSPTFRFFLSAWQVVARSHQRTVEEAIPLVVGSATLDCVPLCFTRCAWCVVLAPMRGGERGRVSRTKKEGPAKQGLLPVTWGNGYRYGAIHVLLNSDRSTALPRAS